MGEGATVAPQRERTRPMRFILLQHYAPAENCGVPMHEWRPEDIQAHIAFQQALNAELLASGELVDAQGLSDQAKTVTTTGTAPVITAGPFPEPKELLAG